MGFAKTGGSFGAAADLARWVRAQCGRPQLCPDPLHYAVRLGLDAIPLRPGEVYEPGARELVYEPSPDARARGGCVLVGLARCVLLLAGADVASRSAVLPLAHELALPREAARGLTRVTAAMLAPHAPLAMIDAQITLARKRLRA